jgi:hypothetical protein
MCRYMVSLFILAGLLWLSAKTGLAADTEKSAPRQKMSGSPQIAYTAKQKANREAVAVAYVTSSGKTVKPVKVGTAKTPDGEYWEVVEIYEPSEVKEENVYGFLRNGEGWVNKGPNCFVSGSLWTTSWVGTTHIGTGYVRVRRKIKVIWHGGPQNVPEPKQGVHIKFYHYHKIRARIIGISLGNHLWSTSVKAQAQTEAPDAIFVNTSDPNEILFSVEVYPPVIDTPKNYQFDGLYNLHSGWEGYIVAQIRLNGVTTIYGVSEAYATAEVTWEADTNSGTDDVQDAQIRAWAKEGR